MLNYRDCNIEDFTRAMAQKNDDVKNISNEYLYILYTKFKADATVCYGARTSYSRGIGKTSEQQANLYKSELANRGIDVVAIEQKKLLENLQELDSEQYLD